MARFFERIAATKSFQHGITAVIILAGVLVGIETYPHLAERYAQSLTFFNAVILAIFVAEIVVKMGAEGRTPWRYFSDPWNVFDFTIVVAAFLPIDAQYVTVLRLLRLLRVLKLVKAIPKLQVLVGALLKSLPSMAYVSILLFLLFYVYACAATFLFSGNDPIHFGRLELSMLSLFRAVTLEDWTDLMYINMYGCANYGYGPSDPCTASVANPVGAALFFVSFILIGTMIILNLFIGVIMNGMDEARTEHDRETMFERARHTPTVATELHQVEVQLAAMTEQIAALRAVLAKGPHEDRPVEARERPATAPGAPVPAS